MTKLKFEAPVDAALITAELLIVGYIREDGSNGFMVHARGDMPSSTFLGLTVLAQDEIKGWGATV